jgi:hypothetical protein
VSVTSSEGKGTTVGVDLPLAEGAFDVVTEGVESRRELAVEAGSRQVSTNAGIS